MSDYKEMYHLLFNKITDIICELQTLQQQAEEIFMSHDEATIIELARSTDKKDN
ncbi:MAG: hypothetical protein RSA97_03255 [Oscillospiraceae bacterium]